MQILQTFMTKICKKAMDSFNKFAYTGLDIQVKKTQVILSVYQSQNWQDSKGDL